MIISRKDFVPKLQISLVGLLLAGTILGVSPTPVQAQTTETTTFNVSTTVGATCSVSASDIGFGSYDQLSATNTDSTTTLNVTCTSTTTYEVGLDAGTGTGATTTVRVMEFGANTLNYAMYQDSGHTTNWGDNAGVDTVSGTGTGSSQALTVYGRIPALQSIAPGSYTDLITVTVTF
ncbi:MAG: spore coat U domain-containing protein [Sphingomonadales bacterium]|nr:spore coat U domain-containing protein [Sphingomonadales bacterium]